MNIDFTPEECSMIIRMCEADNMSDQNVATIHFKTMLRLNNYKPELADSDPVKASKKWQTPIGAR